MKPFGLSANALALALGVPTTRIGDILRTEKPRAVTADTAIRLARCFGTAPEFWLNLQTAYDLSLSLAEQGAAIERAMCSRGRVSRRRWRVIGESVFAPGVGGEARTVGLAPFARV